MTLKEELEILRGEPIEFLPKPEEIPCVETSDPEKLCKHPIVSVHMITYNHELYIRQAIEGVMMQKTDFEFELVIGEDASTDKTREICFEYQKRYPDKIRVLWSEHNVNVGPNLTRVTARCRGEFIACCEGDDYWIDPLKLQKQVGVMRKNSNVGLCFTDARIFADGGVQFRRWSDRMSGFTSGLVESKKYLLLTMFGKNPYKQPGLEFWQMTATFLARSSVLRKAMEEHEIFHWKLMVGDSVFCIGLASLSDVYYIGDDTAVYRQTTSGLTLSNGSRCAVDTKLVRLYFLKKCLCLNYKDAPDLFVDGFVKDVFSKFGVERFRRYMGTLELSSVREMFEKRYINWTIKDLSRGRTKGWLGRMKDYFFDRQVTHSVKDLYEQSGLPLSRSDGRHLNLLLAIGRKILTGRAR